MDKEKQIEEKQIEEMARFICHCYDKGYCRMDGKLCDLECGSYKESEIFYEAGYRRQAEGEWLQDFDGDCYCPFCAHYPKEILNYCPKCGAKMKGGTDGES